MERDGRVLLWDALRSVEAIQRYVAGKDAEAYHADENTPLSGRAALQSRWRSARPIREDEPGSCPRDCRPEGCGGVQ